MTSLSTLRAELLDLKAQLVTYCASKLKAGDWHAVQDAASDIREIDAKIDVLSDLAAQPPSVLLSVDAGATITGPLKVEGLRFRPAAFSLANTDLQATTPEEIEAGYGHAV